MQSSAPIEGSQGTALVTGASGALGKALCWRLRRDGWRVVGISSRQPMPGNWHRYAVADVSDAAACAELGAALADERPRVVWHLAGKAHAFAECGPNADEYRKVNAEGTRNTLRLAQQLGARRIVLASSVKAMGEGSFAILDETADCHPATAYGRSKLEAEQILLQATVRIEPVVLRFCMIYGGADRGNMGRMMRAVAKGRFPPFPETHNRRSYVYIDDAVEACVLAGTSPAAANNVFLVTDGRLYTTRRLYLAMREAVGLPPSRMEVPLWTMRCAARLGDAAGLLGFRVPLDSETLSKLTDSSAYTSARITKLLGYKPAWPLDRGLEAMVRDTVDGKI